MALFFLVEDFVDAHEDACFFNVAEFVVYGGSECAHGGRQAHVGVDERRDVESVVADVCVEDFVVVLEISGVEDLFHFPCVDVHLQWCAWPHEVFVVREVCAEEVEYEVAAACVVCGVHGDFAEEVAYVGVFNG